MQTEALQWDEGAGSGDEHKSAEPEAKKVEGSGVWMSRVCTLKNDELLCLPATPR